MAALAATFLFIPALTTRSAVTALPYLTLAGLMLSAQNPPIDAARLDIVPALLWGRAEAIRTLLRSLAQSLAPVLFGVVSDHVFGRAQRPAVDLRRHVGVHGGQRGDPAASYPHLPEGRGDRGRVHARQHRGGVRPTAYVPGSPAWAGGDPAPPPPAPVGAGLARAAAATGTAEVAGRARRLVGADAQGTGAGWRWCGPQSRGPVRASGRWVTAQQRRVPGGQVWSRAVGPGADRCGLERSVPGGHVHTSRPVRPAQQALDGNRPGWA